MTMFYKPKTLDSALEYLSADEEARPLSGGQTLVPMMNLGLLRPQAVVSLNAIDELGHIERLTDGWIRIGATVSHRRIAQYGGFVNGQRLMSDTAIQIAHPAVRNAGTIGGACAHGDPAADWPVTLCAADALIEIASLTGRRTTLAQEFFVDFLTTALQPAELVTAVLIPPLNGIARYRKFGRVDGDYATVSVAAIVESHAGRCNAVQVALGSVSSRPVRSPSLERELTGQPLNQHTTGSFARALASLASPMSDVRGSADYKQQILPGLISQTLLECTEPC
jgi:carbon-monoxide dehydrogenase medium subunit